MFLFPLGDDVNKRYIPAIGMILISINVVVYFYEARLWQDAEKTMPRWTYHNMPSRAEVEAWLKSTDYYHFLTRWGVTPKNFSKGHVMCAFTYMFLHADIFHLLGNMLVLWALVGTLENTMGQARFMCCYLGWGIAGGIAHATMNWGSDRPMIGASGAIAGMIGAYFIAFGALTRIKLAFWTFFLGTKVIKFSVPAGFLAFLWILSQIAGIADDQKYGNASTAWFAHLGGFAAGVVTMFVLKREVIGRLKRDKITGELQVTEEMQQEEEAVEAEADGEADETAEPAPGSIPSECPNCGEPVSVEHKIYDRMLRCPNPSCKKLIMYQ
jgi:membrane associated rhomboid family serine protease